MTTQIIIIFSVMILTYILTKWKLSVELSMLFAAISGLVCGAIFNTPNYKQVCRHMVEGGSTYIDVIFIFTTATLFMNIIKESGGVNYLVRIIMKKFYRKRIIILLLLGLIILIPGALTGAGSVSLLVVGAPVALALSYLGIPKNKVAAILFITAGLSAAAPPVNIWAMIVCAGTAIPYVGFELPLLIPVVVLTAFTVIYLGWKGQTESLDKILSKLPDVPDGMSIWKMVFPFILFFGLVIFTRFFPFALPVLGLPLKFLISAIAAYIVSPKKLNIFKITQKTIKKLLPLLATVVIVGILQQVITVTGVRGLLSYIVISTPLVILYLSLIFIIPISEGVLTYGGAAVFGIPLIWHFNSIGLHPTIVITGLSLLWPLGDGLPPTALIGRLSVMVSNYKGKYINFLKATWLPWIVITIIAIAMVIFSSQLSFLVI